MKLWSKDNTETSEQIEKFTVGRDNEFDILLAEHDFTGTIAHVTMLQQVGLMEANEAQLAINGLKQILEEIKSNTFSSGAENPNSSLNLLCAPTIVSSPGLGWLQQLLVHNPGL